MVAGGGLAVGSAARVTGVAGTIVTGVSSSRSGVFVALGFGVAVILGVAVIVAVGVLVGGALVSEGVADTAGVAGTVSVARAVSAVGEIAVGDSTSLVVVGAGSVVCASIRI